MGEITPVAQEAAPRTTTRGSRDGRPTHAHARHGRSRSRRAALITVFAAILAIGTLATAPQPADAAGPKVVVIVGPVGSATSRYIDYAKGYAAKARSYGASVTEIYTPYATWDKVRAASQGANLLIYLGHGNGWPSPYAPFDAKRKDGFGLNAYAGSGNSKTTYYGEWWIRTYIKLAPNAVVVLNHLCYASGNSEPGYADPTLSVARQRVDNFGAGFLAAGARTVFATGLGSASHVIYSLFRTSRTMEQIFWSDPAATRSYSSKFSSSRTTGRMGILDPYRPGKYYHSMIGGLAMTATTWR